MYGINSIKGIIWNGFLSKIPGHPRKTTLGCLRSYLGRKLIYRAAKTAVFAERVDLKGFNVTLGAESGLGYDCLVMSAGSYIRIGARVTMGPRVILTCGSHHFYSEEGQWKEEKLARPIIVGDECFIATGVIIIGGVTIGNRSVIGAGAVVTKDVPPNSFVGGIPAKVIKSTSKPEG